MHAPQGDLSRGSRRSRRERGYLRSAARRLERERRRQQRRLARRRRREVKELVRQAGLEVARLERQARPAPVTGADGAPGRGRRALEKLARTPELIPGFAAVAVLLFWTASDGGALATDSYPGGLFLLGLLAATAYGYWGRLPRLPRASLAAIALLVAFTLWNFLSISWADDQGAAWDGANRCLLYLTVFALFAIPCWRAGAAALLLGLYVVGITVVGGFTLLEAAGSASPLEYFIADRFSEPTSYHNANAALFTSAMFPAIFLSSRQEIPWPARGTMLASAGVLFQLGLMPQSRGWLIVAPLALIAYLIIVPERVRSLIVLLPLAAVAALTAPPILDVFDAAAVPGELGPALDSARDAMLTAAAILFATGALIGLGDQQLGLSERAVKVGTRAGGALTAAGALAVAIVAIGVIGNPASWAGDRWADFKSGQFDQQSEDSRLGQGLGSNRYDFWMVAMDEFRDSPLAGVGSENFAADYVRDRDSGEEPFHPHSLPLRILSQTGLVGACLFLAFLASAAIGFGRVRLKCPLPLSRGLAGIVAIVLIYWSVHSTGDWFWAFPALSAPVFAWLGLGMSLDRERETLAQPSWIRPSAAAGAVVAVFAAISLALPWGAAIDLEKAAEGWRRDPNDAYERLHRARDLNFLSERPDLFEGAIAARLGDRRRMRAGFERALERYPRSWYARLELAALDALELDRASALGRLREVEDLNPREELTELVREGVVRGRPVSLARLDAALLERVCGRLGRVATETGCETEQP